MTFRDALEEALPDQNVIDRTFINTPEKPEAVERVTPTGRTPASRAKR